MYLLENLSFCGFLKEEILIANLSENYSLKQLKLGSLKFCIIIMIT
jgi:hypothetical protein